MGNCNCKASKNVARAVENSNPSNSVFQYDKDSRKIIYIGEDKVHGDINSAITHSLSVSPTNSESGSGVHDSNKHEVLNKNLSNVRSLLGEIAEYLDEDDNSTFATGSIANASTYSESLATTSTPTGYKSHDNSYVSIQPRQAVSPLLDPEDAQAQNPYSDKKVKNYDELVMLSKEQEMVKSVKNQLYGQKPRKEMVYKNPSNHHEEESLLHEGEDDDQSKGRSALMKHREMYEESKADYMLVKQRFNFDENSLRSGSVHSKYTCDDDQSHETSLFGIEHVLSEDKSEESSSSAYFHRPKNLSAVEEDYVPTDEDDVSVDDTMSAFSIDDDNDEKEKESPNHAYDSSVSFGSFMHVSYAEEEEPVTSYPEADVLNDKTLITLNVDNKPMIFSPELKGKGQEVVTGHEVVKIEDIKDDTLSIKENETRETIPDVEEELLSSEEDIPSPSMPSVVFEIPYEPQDDVIYKKENETRDSSEEDIPSLPKETPYEPQDDAISWKKHETRDEISEEEELLSSHQDISSKPKMLFEKLNEDNDATFSEEFVFPTVNVMASSMEGAQIQIENTVSKALDEAIGVSDIVQDTFDSRVDVNLVDTANIDEGTKKSMQSLLSTEQVDYEKIVDEEQRSDKNEMRNEVDNNLEGALSIDNKKECETEFGDGRPSPQDDENTCIDKMEVTEKETIEMQLPISKHAHVKKSMVEEKHEQELNNDSDDAHGAKSLHGNEMIDFLAEAIVSRSSVNDTRELDASMEDDDNSIDLLISFDQDEPIAEEAANQVTMTNILNKYEQLQEKFSHISSPAPSDEVVSPPTRDSSSPNSSDEVVSPPTKDSTYSTMAKSSSTKSSVHNTPKSKTPPRTQLKSTGKIAIRSAPDDFPDDVSEMSMRSVRSTSKARTPPRKHYGPTPTKSSLLRLAANNPNSKNDDSSVQTHFSMKSQKSSILSVTPDSLPWDEKKTKTRKSRMTPPSSASSVCSSISNRSNAELIREGRRIARERVVAYRSAEKKKKCTRKWNPTEFAKKKGCIRCISLASIKERERYYSEGRHARVVMTCGGCERSCPCTTGLIQSYPELEINEDEHYALCRICFNALHR